MENEEKPRRHKDLKDAYRTAYLIAGFLKETLTVEEKEELDAWILASDENMMLFEKMTDEKNIEQAADWLKTMNVDAQLKATKRKIQRRQPLALWSAIAAAMIILIVASVYFFNNNSKENEKTHVAVEKKDIAPGSNMATLTLDNGEQIALNSNGADTTLNNQIKILRKDGQLVYNNGTDASSLVYNTLTVPRKGQYKVVLADGSKVWLNAESSIRYPIAFTGNERKVFVTGETFFDVAKDKSKPFRVMANDIMVEALGTQFNINTYNNEPYFTATLIDGSVSVTRGAEKNILKPGQQAQIRDKYFHIVNANTDNVTAWKNNLFKFSGAPINEIMRQVERWYDADVVYQENVNLHLNATIERSVPVSKLLSILEQTGQVKFKVEGKKIIVME